MTALLLAQVHEIVSDGTPSTCQTVHRGSHTTGRASIIVVVIITNESSPTPAKPRRRDK